MHRNIWSTSLFLITTAYATPSLACDFCMLGQGISPYMTATGKGMTVAAHYRELDTVYNRNQSVDSEGKKEAWTLFSLTGFYPLTDELTVLVTLPYASKSNVDLDDTSGLNTGTITTGIGDMTTTLRYTLFNQHSSDSTFIGGLLAGVKLPTGTTNNRDQAGEAIDRHGLPGTGSWDFDLGFSGAYMAPSGFQITLDAVYRLSTTGKWAERDHRFGNLMNYAARAYYRVAKMDSHSSVMPFLGVSGETTGKETGADDPTSGDYTPGLTNESTGGTVLFGDIGIYSTLNMNTVVSVGFSKSFYHQMNFDPAFETDPAENYKIDLSITYLF